MDRYEKHIFVCINERPADSPKGSCSASDSMQVFQKFRAEITERNLKGRVCASKSGCLAACASGPMVVVYPEGVWYQKVMPADVCEIIEQHVLNGEPVERLRYRPA